MIKDKIANTYFLKLCIALVGLTILGSCNQWAGNKQNNLDIKPKNKITIDVTATAYNSIENQTKEGNVGLAAWGDILQPGERAIAVSRDLIALGLDHNEEVSIEGLPGIYIVKDKMNKRWKKKVDIYMGLDVEAAREWGKKNLAITFNRKDNPDDKFSIKKQ